MADRSKFGKATVERIAGERSCGTVLEQLPADLIVYPNAMPVRDERMTAFGKSDFSSGDVYGRKADLT